jgi:hypothetical protein
MLAVLLFFFGLKLEKQNSASVDIATSSCGSRALVGELYYHD